MPGSRWTGCSPSFDETVRNRLQITPETESLIDRALSEDVLTGDPTTEILIPPDMPGRAGLVAREDGVLAGLDVALAVFRRVDMTLTTHALIEDGARIRRGDLVGEVEGRLASILTAERTALNFLRRLSGVATETSVYVSQVEEYPATIVDTRKTTPGMRTLEKYAVRAGGGRNHRRNLGDGILIKDNHVEALRTSGMSLGDVVRKAGREKAHTINVEVEVEDLEQVEEALDAGAEILLLDNMGLEEMAAAVRMASGRAVTEASGNITLRNVRDVAATGVDLISVGALTHSSRALDISLDMV